VRLAKGKLPQVGQVALGDIRNARRLFPDVRAEAKAVITSPPYLDVTSFEEDQWLRLWFLGRPPAPSCNLYSADDRYYDRDRYWRFIAEGWQGIEPLMAPGAMLVCRIGGLGLSTPDVTTAFTECLRSAFPDASRARRPHVSPLRNRQTGAFRPGSKGCSVEIDYVFALSPGKIEVPSRSPQTKWRRVVSQPSEGRRQQTGHLSEFWHRIPQHR